MSWFRNLGRKNKNKSTTKTNKSSHNGFTSTRPECNGTASGSLAEAMLFPMQYNGPTYDFKAFPDELIFIPYDDTTQINIGCNLFSKSSPKKINHKYGVSALLIHGNPKNNPTHFMILFHGNGVDLGMASAIWRPLIRALPIHLLIVEYPGYGIMDGRCTCSQVINVAEMTYKYVTRTKSNGGLGINTDKLIILGRSIGTGPASHIAKQKCLTLILVSPFTSIHNLSSDLMGKWTKWMLPKDYGNQMDDDEDNDNDDDEQKQYNLNNQKKNNSIHSLDESYFDEEEEEEEEENKYNDLNGLPGIKEIKHSKSTPNNDNNIEPFCYPNIRKPPNRSKSAKNVRNKKKSSKKKGSFVFNNVTQIEKWQCKNFMVFHGKNDELIPYAHTNTIVKTIKNVKPELNAKKFLIDGVGHNDVNIQFIGLRIFMQYQEELQSSFSEDSLVININELVPYLDNPPQFDIITNKVQNFNNNNKLNKKKIKTNKMKKKFSASVPSLFGSDDESDDDEENNQKQIKLINEWNQEKGEFINYQRNLPTKIYDLSLKSSMESQKHQMEKAENVVKSGWI